MIGFNRLGRQGRLGNQMFQYASLRGIAANRGFAFAIPPTRFLPSDRRHQLVESFALPGLEHIKRVRGRRAEPATFAFDEVLFNTVPDGRSLVGYFQTEKYFKHIEAEIRADFRFKDGVREAAAAFVTRYDNPIALHVRRGDYLEFAENHPPCTEKYYRDAIALFAPERPILVFSDDPGWCRETFSDRRFLIVDGGDQCFDLCAMSLCGDFIIANSSFSWWGSWLSRNENKIIAAPSRWFGIGYTASLDLSDLYCENWTVIEV